jgi:hypothetical protein
LQRFVQIGSSTINATGASVFANAYGLTVNAPVAGTNATITNSWALGCNGNASIGGNAILGALICGSETIGSASATLGTLTLYNATNANPLKLQPGATASNITLTLPTALPSTSNNLPLGSDSLGNMSFLTQPQFGSDSTGTGTALLGANCPASSVSAPQTWLKAYDTQGNTVWIPGWK